MSSASIDIKKGTLFGHPTGLFTLFFAEMWERFSYYGMRALLVFYMTKGFLRYNDTVSYAVYGFYTSLVYMTPFFGGMIADKILGSRRAVVLGGILMAAGHLMMTMENTWAFYCALALLVAGNGFFKPNISTIVGTLYEDGSPKRDGGFTIFYMGINLGAAMSPLLCGYIGEAYDWHYGFGLATIGMLLGVAVFVAPSIIAQLAMFAVSIIAAFNIFFVPIFMSEMVEANPNLPGQLNLVVLVLLGLAGAFTFYELGKKKLNESDLSKVLAMAIIMVGALVAAGVMFWIPVENIYSKGVYLFTGIVLLAAGIVAVVALSKGGLPAEAGEAPDPVKLTTASVGPFSPEMLVYLGTLIAIPILLFLVSGFAPITADGLPISVIPDAVTKGMSSSDNPVLQVLGVVVEMSSTPAGIVLVLAGLIALGYLIFETVRLEKIARDRMVVVLILTFFSMLFWAFFEQAGSSVNNFTDRNVDRVFEAKTISESDVQSTIKFRMAVDSGDADTNELPMLTQEQLGHEYGNDSLKTQIVKSIRAKEEKVIKEIKDGEKRQKKQNEMNQLIKDVTKENKLTMTALTYLRDDKSLKTVDWQVTEENVGMGVGGSEMPASVFQAINPIYILIFGIIFSLLWTFLGSRGLEPSTPVKFSLGLLQLGLGFTCFWYGAHTATTNGMVGLTWLMLGYLLQTTGELCLSPVGLSMVTKLSPTRLVSTVMGMWFLATAFSQLLAAIIAQFTGVGHGGEGGSSAIPVPSETVNIYGGVFAIIAWTAVGSGVFCLLLSPLLSYWMHEKKAGDKPDADEAGAPFAPRPDQSEHIKPTDDQIQGNDPPEDPDTNIKE